MQGFPGLQIDFLIFFYILAQRLKPSSNEFVLRWVKLSVLISAKSAIC